eukprot:Phypoly_transcript_13574.p3 GENE.Phypoly_transcript_13574~~Phypoly_transcript_13574.p3  ORF type:complete len:125 (+),score=24.29 Phypoly_transcript_13574:48-422(+)
MSISYAGKLKKGVWKGKCGLPEIFDSDEDLEKKIHSLATLIQKSTHLVAYTGAGISTAAGISDFRGPDGVWTREERGEEEECLKKKERGKEGASFEDANPTVTHIFSLAFYFIFFYLFYFILSL